LAKLIPPNAKLSVPVSDGSALQLRPVTPFPEPAFHVTVSVPVHAAAVLVTARLAERLAAGGFAAEADVARNARLTATPARVLTVRLLMKLRIDPSFVELPMQTPRLSACDRLDDGSEGKPCTAGGVEHVGGGSGLVQAEAGLVLGHEDRAHETDVLPPRGQLLARPAGARRQVLQAPPALGWTGKLEREVGERVDAATLGLRARSFN